MIFFLYFVINMAVLFLFIKKKKHLHILEILVYWMVSSYLFQNLSALCYMNFKTLIIPEKLSYEFAHFLNRIVLFPAIMVLFLSYFLSLRTFKRKLLLILFFLFILGGLEWMGHLTGVLIHVNWKLWWSFAFWLVSLLLLIGFMKFFRKILYRGG
ncbi:hypothetical protein J7I93_20865 [Bacillus sp. ISL-47]|uniref:hypothetical protein n=1 Tax=Bacillus sp. ISL-47 TaxID=2819130 RepID=UPI001BED275E|nr:hypothetical protein [Bacillus sp. ISL-47]MBT2690611.1 hypothetical protein [Bacillus sp. ISL-47]MBT2711193.1 hypothetical protein [Pseudomonas sp. ISL-84]